MTHFIKIQVERKDSILFLKNCSEKILVKIYHGIYIQVEGLVKDILTTLDFKKLNLSLILNETYSLGC